MVRGRSLLPAARVLHDAHTLVPLRGKSLLGGEHFSRVDLHTVLRRAGDGSKVRRGELYFLADQISGDLGGDSLRRALAVVSAELDGAGRAVVALRSRRAVGGLVDLRTLVELLAVGEREALDLRVTS